MKKAAPDGRSFLLEIGTEEIPARMLQGALDSLARRLHSTVVERELVDLAKAPSDGQLRTFGTPRRLAVRIDGLLERQPDKVVEVTGPPVKAAFDPSGKPTRAAEGFARAQGVAVDALRRITTPRGENGFGYDPYFLIPNLSRTAAELTAEQKNKLSHRGQAVADLLRQLGLSRPGQ